MNSLNRPVSLPPGLAGRLNPVCDQFEEQWLAGSAPRLEEFLALVSEADRPALLRELLELELHYRHRRGERSTAAEYHQRLPEYADLIATFFSARSAVSEADTGHFPKGDTPGQNDGPGLEPETACSGTGQPAGAVGGQRIQNEIPGFELLEVLGKGGMGVVYKARHLKLNRLVALKMILAGEHAGPEAVERFLAEARAVAKLSHLNIVQVYEIGEHNGLPYIAMEFVAGGTLSGLWKSKPRAAEVARLVETLAGAMHAAHAHGIIHRDLKPANVLLTAEGHPKIGDFGLAKQLGEDQQTVSGAILGTPSFMAPEQALGQSRNVGPATDVYALGAILYVGLTGRPPFVGDTTMDVLRQVADQEPVSPTQFVAGLPRDLETICLKCLQKAPAQRYVSAQALAEDLRRFREGEPINARPVRWGERVWKWTRRRKALTALMCMTVLVSLLSLVVVLVNQTSEQARKEADLQKQINELSGSFAAALDAKPVEWDVEHMRRLEEMEAELARLAPDQDQALRKRLLDSALEAAIRSARKQELTWNEEPTPLPDQMRTLQRRHPDLFDTVAKSWEFRLVLDLQKPFQNAEELFPGYSFERGDHLVMKRWPYHPLVLSKIPCTGHVEAEVVLSHPTWDVKGPVGLVLAAGQRGTHQHGYMFLVEPTPSSDPEQPTMLSFAETMHRRGTVRLSIYRRNPVHKLPLVQRDVAIASIFSSRHMAAGETLMGATVRLRAHRMGDRLRLVCNDVKLEFADSLQLTVKQGGFFGLYLPTPLPVSSMRAWAKSTTAAPSDLEEADNLYAEERFPEALALYQAQSQGTSNPVIRVEANYKKALCYLGQHEYDKASELLKSIIQNPAADIERWHILAMCQLWAVKLRQGKDAEAEAVFRNLPRHRLNELLVFVPDHICQSILMHYRWRMTGLGMVAMLHHGTKGREMALEIEELFHSSRANVLRARFLLFRAYFLNGQTEQAREQASLIHKAAPLPDLTTELWWYDFWEEYSLMLRQAKQGERALAHLDKLLAGKKAPGRAECLPLLMVRATLNVHLGQPKQAERDLDKFFRLAKPEQIASRFWTRACLMRGLLRESTDPAAAHEAWLMGVPSKDGKIDWVFDRANVIALGQQIALAHLCDKLSDAELENLKDFVFRYAGSIKEYKDFKEMFRTLLPDFTVEKMGPALRKSLSSQEGRKLIRQLAFQEVNQVELARSACVFGLETMSKKMLEPYELSLAENALVQKSSNDLFDSLITGKLTRNQLIKVSPLAFLWSDQPVLAILGWDWPASALEPKFRGPLAYAFGLRYLHVFKKPEEATTYFQRAYNLAPKGSELRALAGDQLKRLKKK